MKTKLIIDEDSVYEIDEECDQVREEQERNRRERRQRSGWPGKRKRELLREVSEDGDFLRCYALRGTLEERKLRLTLFLAKHKCFALLCQLGWLRRTGIIPKAPQKKG